MASSNPTTFAYKKIKNHFRKDILNGEYNSGDRLPTVTEIADSFNVSRVTVIRSVKELVEEGLIESKRGVGLMVRHKAEMVSEENKAVLSIEISTITFSPEIRRAIESCIHGWQLFEMHIDEYNIDKYSEQFWNQFIQEHKYPAYLLSSVPLEVKQYFLNKGLTCVVVGELEDGIDLPNVVTDEFSRFYQATKYLCSQGYPRIAFVQHTHKERIAQDRDAGVSAACNEFASNGLDVPEVIPFSGYDRGSFDEACAAFFATTEFPVGVVCCNDMSACWLVQNAVERGISIPGQLGVITEGSTTYPAMTNPAITSIRYDHAKYGFSVGKMIMDVTRGYEPEQRHVKIPFDPPYIIPRATTKNDAMMKDNNALYESDSKK